MNSMLSIFRERPIAFSIGYTARLLDYAKIGVDRAIASIPKEFRTLALLNSFLGWTGGSITSPQKGFFKVVTKQQGKDLNVILRSRSSDIMTFAEVIVSGEYAPIIELMQKHARSSVDTIVDVGANIGLSTLLFKSYFPDARVICIEPDADNIAVLQQNLRENNFSNCDIIQAGLWYKDCQLALSNEFRDGLSWSITVVEREDGTIRGLGTESLVKECHDRRIGLLKIDIEGSEFEIFRHSDSIVTLLDRTDFLVAEIHEEFGSIEEIQNILSANNFSTTTMGHVLIGMKNNI